MQRCAVQVHWWYGTGLSGSCWQHCSPDLNRQAFNNEVSQDSGWSQHASCCLRLPARRLETPTIASTPLPPFRSFDTHFPVCKQISRCPGDAVGESHNPSATGPQAPTASDPQSKSMMGSSAHERVLVAQVAGSEDGPPAGVAVLYSVFSAPRRTVSAVYRAGKRQLGLEKPQVRAWARPSRQGASAATSHPTPFISATSLPQPALPTLPTA